MADLISRAAAIVEVEEYLQELNSCISEPDLKLDGYRNGLQVAIQELKALPAVDAAPVIRCRDCEHFIDMSGTSYPSYCYKHTTFDADGEFDNVFGVEPDKYCSWGERRDSE